MASPQELAVQDINDLFLEINNELRQAPTDGTLIAPQIAWLRTGKTGLKTNFSLQMVSNAYKKRRPGEPTPMRKVELAKFSCEIAELDVDAYFIPEIDLDGDIHGIIEPNLPAIVSRAQLCIDQELAVQICANPATIYDGVTFFNATKAHPYNPLRRSLGLFANKYTGVNISRASLTQALDYFNLMVGFDGKIERKSNSCSIY